MNNWASNTVLSTSWSWVLLGSVTGFYCRNPAYVQKYVGHGYFFVLSGGLDSSLVASVACRQVRENPDAELSNAFPRIHSFSVGLKGSPDLKVMINAPGALSSLKAVINAPGAVSSLKVVMNAPGAVYPLKVFTIEPGVGLEIDTGTTYA